MSVMSADTRPEQITQRFPRRKDSCTEREIRSRVILD